MTWQTFFPKYAAEEKAVSTEEADLINFFFFLGKLKTYFFSFLNDSLKTRLSIQMQKMTGELHLDSKIK